MIMVFIVVLAAVGIAVYTLVENRTQSVIQNQDIYNVVITIVMLLVVAFLPQITSVLQIMIYKIRHLDGDQHIVVEDEKFSLTRENGPELIISFSAVTRVIERDTHIKVTSGTKVMYLQKEDFIEGEPKALMKYLQEVIE